MHLVIVSHALVLPENRNRWVRLVDQHRDVRVTLIVPRRWESRWFGQRVQWRSAPEIRERYEVLPLAVTHRSNWHRCVFVSMDAHLRKLCPDLIYVMEEESTWMLQQMIVCRNIWSPRAPLVFFTWNNLATKPNWRQHVAWRRTCRYADGAVAGNRDAAQLLQQNGFVHPVLVQTEIGIDPDVFKPDLEMRLKTRGRLDLTGFVVGFAGRLTEAKGVLDLAEALHGIDADWQLLVVGDGALRTQLEQAFAAWNLSPRLRFANAVTREQMPAHLNAMDCLVLPSRTTPTWKEQFGLVLAEAMACGVPVLGSSSGAIPDVLGDADLVFSEGDAVGLRALLERTMRDAGWRAHSAVRGQTRANVHFSAEALCRELLAFLQTIRERKP